MEKKHPSVQECPVTDQYQKPAIEIIEMELEQPLLASSGGGVIVPSGSGVQTPLFLGNDW